MLILIIAGGWALGLLVALGLCRAAALADEEMEDMP